MKNHKIPYEKGDEKFWWNEGDWLLKEKRRRRIRRERNRRDKFSFDRNREEPYFE